MRHITPSFRFLRSTQTKRVKTSSQRACLSLNKKDRVRRWGSLLVIPFLLISILSVNGSGLFSSTAGAVTPPTNQADCTALGGTWTNNDHIKNLCTLPPYINMSLDQQVQSYVYYYTLGNCLANGFLHDGGYSLNPPSAPHQRINIADVTSGLWFAGSSQNGGGYLNGVSGIKTTPDGGGQAGTVIDCQQTGLVKGALALWGNWAPDEALCAFGYVRASGPASRCTNAQGGTDEFMKGSNVESSFKTAVLNRIYGGKAPTLTNAAKYLLYLKAFKEACVPNATATSTPPTGNSTNDYAIKVVSGDGASATVSTVYYTDYRNLDSSATVYLYPNVYLSPPGAKQTCGSLAKGINDFASIYKDYLGATGSKNNSSGSGSGCASGATTDSSGNPCNPSDQKSSCTVQGIGWLVCPVLTFIASINDGAFSFLSSTFLETKASILEDPSVQSAWSAMRNLANVAFVIAFLFIIFSQLTGQGVSNYGVKKLLPRLVIAAILVNVSFFICQIAVDISNILGYSLNGVLTNSYAPINVSGGDASGNGFGWTAIVVGVLAGGAALLLAITIPVLLAVLVALLMIVLILSARTALIVLLTIVAPLAFVAFLLPNTEQWYKKWYKMYFALLMVFPIIAVVFGASTLAAGIINRASQGNTFMQIVAIGVAALPLFIVPSLLKGSLSAAGTIGTKLSGMSSKLNGKIGGKVRDTSKLGQLQKYTAQQRQIRRSKILGGVDPRRGGAANPLNWGARVGKTFNESRISGQFGDRASQMGEALAKDEFEKLVKEASISIETMGFGETKLLATTGKTSEGRKVSEVTRAAAIDKMMSAGGFNDRREVLQALASQKDTTTRETRSRAVSAAYAKGDANIYGTGFGDQIVQKAGSYVDPKTGETVRTGTINSAENLTQAAIKNVAEGSLSSEHAVQGQGSTKWLVDQVIKAEEEGNAEEKEIAAVAKAKFTEAADLARASANTRSKITSVINASFEKLGSKASTEPGTPGPSAGPTPPPGPSANTPNSDNAFFVDHEGTTTRGNDTPPSTPPTSPPTPPPTNSTPPSA